MLKTYLKVALRNLWKTRLYTGINITGLSVGLAACVLIVLFVRDELSYDKHFDNSERIYRITGAYNQGGDAKTYSAVTTYPLLPVLAANFPEMEVATRIDFWNQLISRGDQDIWQENIMAADSLVFDLFSVELVAGDLKKAMSEPNNLVLTESAVERHFQDEEALGKVLRISDTDFQVAAIIKDLPGNTHFEAEVFLPTRNAITWYGDWVHLIFNGTSHYSYFRLAEGTNVEDLEARINSYLLETYTERQVGDYSLQAMEDIHLDSDLVGEMGANGNRATVMIFIATALVIVLLACINYINLSIAGSFQRSREVGLKKVFGARASTQLMQFQAESMLVSLVSCIIAVVLVEFMMPYFNQLTGKQLSFDFFQDVNLVASLAALAILIGLISGSFPALFLLKMHTSEALKGNMLTSARGKFNLRNALVVFQFFIAVILIASTFVILNQMNYLRNKDLGITTDQVVVVPMQTGDMAENYETFRDELLRNPGVINVTASNNHPASRVSNWRGYKPDGETEWISSPTVIVTHDFFETLEATMVEGRSFSREYPTDFTEAYVINEAAVKFFQLEEPVGTNLLGLAYTGAEWSRKNAKIIGVVKDFHMASLHNAVRPTVFSLSSQATIGLNFINVRVSPENIRETLSHLESTWLEFEPERPFQYSFMDEDVNEHYVAEDQFLSVFTTFAILSVVIGCLGLFGLTAFIMKRRTKEIGIRKVLGAEIPRLVGVLSKDFLKLVLLANLLGWPLAYLMMDRWLQDFAYSAGIPLWSFAVTGLGALVIAFVSVAYHSIKTASTNPVESIRYE